MDIDVETAGEEIVVSISGEVVRDTSARLLEKLKEVSQQARPRVVLDMSRVVKIDSSAVAVVMHGLRIMESGGIALRLRGLSPSLRQVFEVVQDRSPALRKEEPYEPSALESLGRYVVGLGRSMGDFHHLAVSSIYWTFVAPLTGKGLRFQSTVDQALMIGVNALPIVALISFLMGLIMAMQSDYQLRQFGASIFVADLVGVALTREIAPLMTAVIVAGRSGSSIAAEIGTMKVTEEIDALQAMGFHPVRFLVSPKLLALGVTVPCLTLFSDVVGIFGGLVFAIFGLQISYAAYIEETISALFLSDVVSGIVKSFVFAMIIGQVGSHMGFTVRGGAEGVGRNTTKSVVASIFLIVIADSIFTWLFYSFG
jgi:phospholipid/cholesterol/gamma-HCH transport system permease protein